MTGVSGDFETLRRAHEAMRLAEQGERAAPKPAKSPSSARAKAAPKAAPKALNATAREAAMHRAQSLLRTMSEYYCVTVGEVEDEVKRLGELSDERLMGTIRGLEFASRHVQVMLHDERAREAGISKDSDTQAFYSANGVSQDEIDEPARRLATGRPARP